MSHQIIITFDLDENKVQENAEKEAGRQIANKITDMALGSSYYRENAMKRYVQDALRELIEQDKEKIIEETIREMVTSLSRTKAVKEKMAEILK